MKAVTYLLCGLPGSGKTTYAKELEKTGALRLTLDEELFKRFGRDFVSGYDDKEQQTKAELTKLWYKNVVSGRATILDFGFWKRQERTTYKQLAETYGSEWKLIFFSVDYNELRARLHSRNETNIESNHYISEALLDDFINCFEAPVGEGEEQVSG